MTDTVPSGLSASTVPVNPPPTPEGVVTRTLAPGAISEGVAISGSGTRAGSARGLVNRSAGSGMVTGVAATVSPRTLASIRLTSRSKCSGVKRFGLPRSVAALWIFAAEEVAVWSLSTRTWSRSSSSGEYCSRGGLPAAMRFSCSPIIYARRS